MQEVIARSDFWHDAAELLVLCDLRGHFTGEQLAVAKNCDCCFVTGGFESEDGHAKK
jgi:hypothetical protein